MSRTRQAVSVCTWAFWSKVTRLEPGLVHAVGAIEGCGAGRRRWAVWLSGLRQEEHISETTGQSSKFLFDAKDSASKPFGKSPSFSFVPGRAAGLVSKMSPKTHKDKDAGTALWSLTMACEEMFWESETTWQMKQAR